MRFTIFHLIYAALFFFLFIFGIQYSLFTGNNKISNNINIQILWDFQFSVQQCMVSLSVLNFMI
ncbi:unnamed protein product, partial [Vitis vinifera]|uniref:Uncharacterized protein n=1 Tax=Vitis vinifera TaxID=29760 RepID=D7SRD5_VITVI